MRCEHDVCTSPRTALSAWLLLGISLWLALSDSVFGLGAVAAQAADVPNDDLKPGPRNGLHPDGGPASVAIPASASRQTLAADAGSRPVDTHARTDTRGHDGPFLIPLLPFGLSNQVLALKEALALAAVLNWTVVALGFWPHSSELATVEGLTAQPGGIRDAGQLRLAATAAAAAGADARMDPVPDRQALRRVPLPGASTSTKRRRVLHKQRQQQQQHQPKRGARLEGGSGGGEGRAGPGPGPSTSTSSMIPFDLVFDRQALAPLVRVISREEAVQLYGWSQSGRADALLSISATSGLTSTLQKTAAAGLLDAQGVRTVRNHGFRCDDGGLSWLRRAAEGHRWVALYSYRRVVPAARSSYRSFAQDSSPCARMYHQVSLRLRKSPAVRETAQRFMDAALASLQQPGGAGAGDTGGGGDGGGGGGGGGHSSGAVSAGDRLNGPATVGPPQLYYIALHVRPYPDTCFEYFAGMTEFDAAAASWVCRNPRLLVNMVPIVRQLLAAQARAAAAGTAASSGGVDSDGSADADVDAPPRAAVFVMSHPRIRAVLRRELSRLWHGSQGGSAAEGDGAVDAGRGRVEPSQARAQAAAVPLPPLPALFFLDAADLPPALRGHVAVNSLLSVVEQEVCRRAAAFIGTKASSISVLVAQERVAADADADAQARVAADVDVEAVAQERAAQGEGASEGRAEAGAEGEKDGAVDSEGGEGERREPADGGLGGSLPEGSGHGSVRRDRVTILF